MDWHVLQDTLTSQHEGRPQKQRMIEHALREIELGLSALAALGHPYHLAPGAAPAICSWPRMYYNLEAAPEGRLVNSSFDLDELGEGWYSSLALAKHMDGLRQQFLGRGGVTLGGLPAITAFAPAPGEAPSVYLLARSAREGFILAELTLKWSPVDRAQMLYRTESSALAKVVTEEIQLRGLSKDIDLLISPSMPKAEILAEMVSAKSIRQLTT